jgi:hypothetical protein
VSRLLVSALIGFMVGLFGMSTVVVLRGSEVGLARGTEPLPTGPAVGDSAVVEGGGVQVDSATLAAGAPEPADEPAGGAVSGMASSSSADTAAAEVVDGDGGPRRLARIFAVMRPAEAARVLEQLDDREIRAILGHVGERKAAAILASFEPARAAAVSRGVLREGGAK